MKGRYNDIEILIIRCNYTGVNNPVEVSTIAEILERSSGSVRAKLCQLGLYKHRIEGKRLATGRRYLYNNPTN
jgi:predicted transcriptional regulator